MKQLLSWKKWNVKALIWEFWSKRTRMQKTSVNGGWLYWSFFWTVFTYSKCAFLASPLYSVVERGLSHCPGCLLLPVDSYSRVYSLTTESSRNTLVDYQEMDELKSYFNLICYEGPAAASAVSEVRPLPALYVWKLYSD